jgi:hypothetical protein
MIPEYHQGAAPKPYQSNFDIANLPDEVFEVYNPNDQKKGSKK